MKRILDHPIAYKMWQSPFANQKVEPVLRHNNLANSRRVLDVGCGPGTNTGLFKEAQYLGIDLNQRYIDAARRRFGREFVAADVTTYSLDPNERFDFIFVNSLLHHLDDDETRSLLARLSELLSCDGCIHILDLVMPEEQGFARMLAKSDRGEYARPLEQWREMFETSFDTAVFEPYAIGALGVTLWEMLYFQGRARLR
jgi:trans-aconitate methyltransferase